MKDIKMRSNGIALFALLALSSSTAHAALTISNKPTQNVLCSAGTCTATAKNGVLNVTDLGDMLTTTDITIKSGNLARDIVFDTAFSWTSGNGMALDAFRSIEFGKAVSVAGSGGVSLIVNDGGTGGTFFFTSKGKVSFPSTSNSLTIGMHAYTLVDSLPALADDITSNPSGFYALANSYDAAADGVYSSSPVATTFSGAFNGLGNAISNMTIVSDANRGTIGLFSIIGAGAAVNSLSVNHVTISDSRAGSAVGALAGGNFGLVFNDSADGSIDGGINSQTGGLVGVSTGSVIQSHASTNVTAGKRSWAGGLVGSGTATSQIINSYATGNVTTTGTTVEVGGLIGESPGIITNSYARGAVKGGKGSSEVGGLVGGNDTGSIAYSYSTGSVGAKGGLVGGFSGFNVGTVQTCYWDTNTSGTQKGSGGGSSEGITGLTTEEFISNLPSGFDPAVWAQSATINNGYPYLIANPPAK